MSKMETGPEMPSREAPVNGVERLKNIRLRLEQTKKDLDMRIDDLMKNLGQVITAAEENSINAGKQDEVIRETLESQEIMRQVHELRESSERLSILIEDLGGVGK
jgi:hypothetical protein